MERLPGYITASTVGVLIALANLLLAPTGLAAVLSEKRRIAGNIRQIFEICEHSVKDIAKQRLQEKADALILRYAAVTLIRYPPWELVVVIFFYAALVGLFAAFFFIDTFRHKVQGLPDWLSVGVIFFVPLLINIIPLFLRRRLQVNRQLFVLLDAPPINHFRDQVRRLKGRYYFSRKPADTLYKLMLDLQKQAASESSNNTPKQLLIDYLDDAIAAIQVKRRRHDRSAAPNVA